MSPTHTLKVLDNNCGDHDQLWMLAYKKDGVFFCFDTDKPVLEYEGDEIINEWRLSDDPHTETIPLDGRYSDSKPKITNDMKAVCNGEFSFFIDEPCPKCAYHLDENYDDIPCLCDDSDDNTYSKEIMVPWTTVKEIYQKMAVVAIEDDKS